MSEGKMIITLDDLVVEFASNMSLGMKAIKAAAETYVMAITKYPTRAREEFAARFKTIRKETWSLLESIGKQKLPPQAMMMSSGAVQKLLDAKIPYEKLCSVADGSVSVYNPKNGAYNMVQFSHLTEGQADIVLNPVTHSLRTEAQQLRYAEKLAKKEAVVAVEQARVKSPDWVLGDCGLVAKKGVTIPIDALVSELKTRGYI